MSCEDSISVEEVSAPTKGRLKRAPSTDEENYNNQQDQFQFEQPDSIQISDQSEVEIEQQTKPKKKQSQLQKPRKPRQKKMNENAANQNEESAEKPKKENKPKQQKKVMETNDTTVENLLSKKFILADDEDEPPRRQMDVEEYGGNRDTYGGDGRLPKKQKAERAKNINQLIKNRHKFFTCFEDAPENYEEDHYEQMDGDQHELKFEKKMMIEESGIKQKAKRDMLAKVEQYKQNVLVFGDQSKSILATTHTVPSNDSEGIQKKINALPALPVITKTSSLIIEEHPMQQVQESKSNMFKRTFSMGLKKGLTQPDLDDPEIQLFIPKISGAKDKIFENTLFLNKIKQKGLDRVVHTSTSLNNSNKAYSRSEFQLLLQQRQVQHQATKINLSLNDLMNRFQSTTFEQIDAKRASDKNENQNDDDDSSPDEDFVPKQNELNQESEDIDDASSRQSEKLIDDKAEEEKAEEPEKLSKGDQNENAIIEIAESISSIDEDEKQQLQDLHKKNESEEGKSDEEQEDQEQEDEKNNENEENILAEQVRNSRALQKIDESYSENDQQQDIDEEDFKMFRRLKKVSQMFKERKIKEKEAIEKKRLRLERQKEREKMRKFIESNLVENQAEQGSDNESHDDVVKEVHDDDEENENEEMEKELLEMIDDKIEDLNEENEIKAFQIFMDKVHAQEKEDIKKILKGEFKRKNGKVQNIDLLNLEQTEEEKQVRLMHKYESSAEENYDSDFENYMKMNRDEKKEFLKEKRYQKILQAQKEMNQQTKKNRIQENLLFQPKLLEIVEQAKKQNQQKQIKNIRPPTFRQSFLESKRINENSNIENSNSVALLPGQRKDDKKKIGSAINKLFSANIGPKGSFGQQLQKSPNKGVFFTKKK